MSNCFGVGKRTRNCSSWWKSSKLCRKTSCWYHTSITSDWKRSSIECKMFFFIFWSFQTIFHSSQPFKDKDLRKKILQRVNERYSVDFEEETPNDVSLPKPVHQLFNQIHIFIFCLILRKLKSIENGKLKKMLMRSSLKCLFYNLQLQKVKNFWNTSSLINNKSVDSESNDSRPHWVEPSNTFVERLQVKTLINSTIDEDTDTNSTFIKPYQVKIWPYLNFYWISSLIENLWWHLHNQVTK